MIRVLILVAFLTPPGLAAADTAATPPTTTAYLNGYWFNGHQFSHRTVYVVGETFSFRRPRKLDATVDLNGAYVVRPSLKRITTTWSHSMTFKSWWRRIWSTEFSMSRIRIIFHATEPPCCRR